MFSFVVKYKKVLINRSYLIFLLKSMGYDTVIYDKLKNIQNHSHLFFS